MVPFFEWRAVRRNCGSIFRPLTLNAGVQLLPGQYGPMMHATLLQLRRSTGKRRRGLAPPEALSVTMKESNAADGGPAVRNEKCGMVFGHGI